MLFSKMYCFYHYIFNFFRMFNFEKPIFLELIKHIETIHLRPNQQLFMIGNYKQTIALFCCINIFLQFY